MEKCIFCEIVAGKLPSFKLYEDENCLGFLDLYPNSEGHALVIPKKHSENYSMTSPELLADVAKAKQKVVEILETKLPNKPQGFNFVSNQGATAFQMVFHYHEHIIPKYEKTVGYCLDIKHNPADLKPEEIIKFFK